MSCSLSSSTATLLANVSADDPNRANGRCVSVKTAGTGIDLGWLEASEGGQAAASHPKMASEGLMAAVQQVKLANTLSGVLKSAFGHRRSYASPDLRSSSGLSGQEVKPLYVGSKPIGEGSGLPVQRLKTAVCDKTSRPNLAICEVFGLFKQAIQIPAGWQPRPMIDIQKMILKPAQGLSTPLGSSIRAHDASQAELAAKAKPGDQAGTGTSVGPGNSPNIHPITSFSGLGPAGTVNGNAAFGTANSSMKSAGLPDPKLRPWSGSAVAGALQAGLDMSAPADRLRATAASGLDMDSFLRRQARQKPNLPQADTPAIPGAGTLLPNGPGGVVPPLPAKLLRPNPPGAPPLPPNPGRGFPGTNVIESPFAAAAPQVKVADLLPGGRGDGKPDSAFASSSLLKGIKHETEHTKRRPIAKEIAKDHLSEDPAYYRKLEQVEDPKLVDMPKLPAMGKLPRGSDVKATKRTFAEAGQQWYRDVEAVRELATTGHARRTMTQEKFLEWLARPEGQLKVAVSDEALGMKADGGGLGSIPKLGPAAGKPLSVPPIGGLGGSAPTLKPPEKPKPVDTAGRGTPPIEWLIPPKPPTIPLPATGTSMSPLHQLPVGQMRTDHTVNFRSDEPVEASPYASGINPKRSVAGLQLAGYEMHRTGPRATVTDHLVQHGYQTNGPAEKMLYERSLGGGLQPPRTGDPSVGLSYSARTDPQTKQITNEGVNLPAWQLRTVDTNPESHLLAGQPDTLDWIRQQPHVTARHETEHAKQVAMGLPRSYAELGPSLGDTVHMLSADRMTRGQDLPTTVETAYEDPNPDNKDGRLNLHQFARQARASGWPQVSMSELLEQPSWVGKRQQLSNYGRKALDRPILNARIRVLQRGQDPNLKMPQPLLKSSSVKELWNHPARPFVTQAAVGAGTSLALNEVLRRAIEAYQGKKIDPEDIRRERLMAAGMGAGMGLSRAATPHLQAAVGPYVKSLLG